MCCKLTIAVISSKAVRTIRRIWAHGSIYNGEHNAQGQEDELDFDKHLFCLLSWKKYTFNLKHTFFVAVLMSFSSFFNLIQEKRMGIFNF